MIDTPLPSQVSPKTVPKFVAAARKGRGDALGTLLQAYGPYLLAIARREFDPLLAGKLSPSDVVQETFVDAQRDFAAFETDDHVGLKRWLRRLLRNNLEDCRRLFADSAKRDVERERSIHWLTPGAASAAEAAGAQLSPLIELIRRENAERLRRAIDRLPVDSRRVLYFRYQLHLSFDEIGKRLGRTAGAARALYQRAIELLKRELAATDQADDN